MVAIVTLFYCSAIHASDCEIVVKAKGSKAHGVYSHFKLLVNDLECGDEHASSTFKDYCFHVPFNASEINEVKIIFDNDLYSIGEDRNLCVHSIIIDEDIPIKANQESARYTCINGEEHPYCGMMLWNGSLRFDIASLRFHPGDVTLTSQKAVNAFTSQYVDGDLVISGKDITDLSSLSSLVSIKGALIIEDNPDLTKIDGLNSIIELGFINIQNNPKLMDIDGFNSLMHCGGMYIRENKLLKTITCFQAREI